MNYENFTKLAKRALKQGGQIARIQNHQNIENGHILKGIFDTDRNVFPFLLQQCQIDAADLEDNTEKIITSYLNLYSGGITISSYVEKTLKAAQTYAKKLNDEFISVEHILLGIFSANDSVSTLLKNKGLTEQKIFDAILKLRNGVDSDVYQTKYSSVFKDYAIDQTDIARQNLHYPVVELENELNSIIEILGRHNKNFVLLVGAKGTGKTSTVNALAQRIVKGNVPSFIKQSIVLKIKLFDFINETREDGIALRMSEIIDDTEKEKRNIVFFDDFELLLKNTSYQTQLKIFSLLEDAAMRHSIMLIATTSKDGFDTCFSQNKILTELFTIVQQNVPKDENLHRILASTKTYMELHHAISIHKNTVEAAIRISSSYTNKCNPALCVDLLDRAASQLALSINSVPQHIVDIEDEIREIKLMRVAEEDEQKRKQLEDKLPELIDEKNKQRAIWESVRSLIAKIAKTRQYILKLNNEIKIKIAADEYEEALHIKTKKIPEAKKHLKILNDELTEKYSSKLPFKNELTAEHIAQVAANDLGESVEKLLLSPQKVIENLDKHLNNTAPGKKQAVSIISNAIKRREVGIVKNQNRALSFLLLGTPGCGKQQLAYELADYKLNNRTKVKTFDATDVQISTEIADNELSRWIEDNPYSIVLIKNIEKATSVFLHYLTNAVDTGVLSNGYKKILTRDIIFVFTTNIAANRIFSAEPETSVNTIRPKVMKIIQKKFDQHFIRLQSGIAIIMPPTEKTLKSIAFLKLQKLQKKLKNNNINLMFTPLIADFVASKSKHPKLGALLMENVIRKYVENPIADAVIKGEVNRDQIVFIAYEDAAIEVKNVDNDIAQRLIKASEKLSIKAVSPDEDDIMLTGGELNETTVQKKSFLDKLKPI